jgi:hypothetical protein
VSRACQVLQALTLTSLDDLWKARPGPIRKIWRRVFSCKRVSNAPVLPTELEFRRCLDNSTFHFLCASPMCSCSQTAPKFEDLVGNSQELCTQDLVDVALIASIIFKCLYIALSGVPLFATLFFYDLTQCSIYVLSHSCSIATHIKKAPSSSQLQTCRACCIIRSCT